MSAHGIPIKDGKNPWQLAPGYEAIHWNFNILQKSDQRVYQTFIPI